MTPTQEDPDNKRYEEHLLRSLTACAEAWSRARKENSSHESIGKLRHLVHTIAGSAGSFGFGPVGETARELDIHLGLLTTIERTLSPEETKKVDDLLRTMNEQSRPPVSEEVRPGAGDKQSDPPTPSSPIHILIVDDDEYVRRSLSRLLKWEGYTISEAANGSDALKYLKAHAAPGVILLDLMMPVMNGWEFRAEQQKDPALARIPLVAISADAQMSTRARSIQATAYLEKPFDVDTLLETLQSVRTRN